MNKVLPICAFALFRLDYPNLNYYQALYYYREQCAGKELFGSKYNIKFIDDE